MLPLYTLNIPCISLRFFFDLARYQIYKKKNESGTLHEIRQNNENKIINNINPCVFDDKTNVPIHNFNSV